MVDADKRRERMSVLKSLGFTHQQAFRLANARSETVSGAISQAKKDLEAIPRNERTDTDRERLKAFRGVRIRNNPRILSKEEKRDQWSHWSSQGNNFPPAQTQRIRELNENAGKDPLDSFGYQAYYFEYVEEFADVDDGDFYEQASRR